MEEPPLYTEVMAVGLAPPAYETTVLTGDMDRREVVSRVVRASQGRWMSWIEAWHRLHERETQVAGSDTRNLNAYTRQREKEALNRELRRFVGHVADEMTAWNTLRKERLGYTAVSAGSCGSSQNVFDYRAIASVRASQSYNELVQRLEEIKEVGEEAD